MGIKLMVEIMDHWQDAGLTAGERGDLLVLAENAKDSTRETFGPVHEDYILRRVGKKAAGWRVAIAALKNKGVLEYAIRDGREMSGRPGQHAVYRFPVLCSEPPHDGLRGQCTRAERVSSQLTHSEPDGGPMGYPTANPLDGMGYPTATERVSPDLTPTPPNPSGTTSSSDPAEPTAEADSRGGGGGEGQQEQDRAAAFLENLPGRWAAGRATAQRLAPLLLEAVVRQGWELGAELAAKLTEDLGPVRTYPGALEFRIGDLPKKPTAKTAGLSGAAASCTNPTCDPLTNMIRRPDGDVDFCPTCHPTGRVRARQNQGAA